MFIAHIHSFAKIQSSNIMDQAIKAFIVYNPQNLDPRHIADMARLFGGYQVIPVEHEGDYLAISKILDNNMADVHLFHPGLAWIRLWEQFQLQPYHLGQFELNENMQNNIEEAIRDKMIKYQFRKCKFCKPEKHHACREHTARIQAQGFMTIPPNKLIHNCCTCKKEN